MYEFDIDLIPQRRSFRQGRDVYSVVLEAAWWQEFERVCPNQGTRKGWILEWIEDAKVKGCNRQALIRYRIHQLAMEEAPEPAPDPKQEILDRIGELRKKRVPWRDVAKKLNEQGLTSSSGDWTAEGVKGFYYMNKG